MSHFLVLTINITIVVPNVTLLGATHQLYYSGTKCHTSWCYPIPIKITIVIPYVTLLGATYKYCYSGVLHVTLLGATNQHCHCGTNCHISWYNKSSLP